MTLPREIVVFSEPGPTTFRIPEWAEWIVVAGQGGEGCCGSQGALFQHAGPVKPDGRMVMINVGKGGRGVDHPGHPGFHQGRNAYVLVELYEETPDAQEA